MVHGERRPPGSFHGAALLRRRVGIAPAPSPTPPRFGTPVSGCGCEPPSTPRRLHAQNGPAPGAGINGIGSRHTPPRRVDQLADPGRSRRAVIKVTLASPSAPLTSSRRTRDTNDRPRDPPSLKNGGPVVMLTHTTARNFSSFLRYFRGTRPPAQRVQVKTSAPTRLTINTAPCTRRRYVIPYDVAPTTIHAFATSSSTYREGIIQVVFSETATSVSPLDAAVAPASWQRPWLVRDVDAPAHHPARAAAGPLVQGGRSWWGLVSCLSAF